MTANQDLLRAGADLLICGSIGTVALFGYRRHERRERERVAEPEIETAAYLLYQAAVHLTAPGDSLDPWLLMDVNGIYPLQHVQQNRVRNKAFELGLLVPKAPPDAGKVAIPFDGPYGWLTLQAECIGKEIRSMNAGDTGAVINSPFNTVTVNMNSFPPELVAALLAELKRLATDTSLHEPDRTTASELSTELDDIGTDQSRLKSFFTKVTAASSAATSGFDAINGLLRLLGYGS